MEQQREITQEEIEREREWMTVFAEVKRLGREHVENSRETYPQLWNWLRENHDIYVGSVEEFINVDVGFAK